MNNYTVVNICDLMGDSAHAPNEEDLQKMLSKLKKGKTYYVRVRTYKTVSGTKYYSSWSSVKKVKIKK